LDIPWGFLVLLKVVVLSDANLTVITTRAMKEKGFIQITAPGQSIDLIDLSTPKQDLFLSERSTAARMLSWCTLNMANEVKTIAKAQTSVLKSFLWCVCVFV
jgi:hypothetical protein